MFPNSILFSFFEFPLLLLLWKEKNKNTKNFIGFVLVSLLVVNLPEMLNKLNFVVISFGI